MVYATDSVYIVFRVCARLKYPLGLFCAVPPRCIISYLSSVNVRGGMYESLPC